VPAVDAAVGREVDVARAGEDVKEGRLKVLGLFPDQKALKRRAKEISESAWAADAVKAAVDAMQAAVTAAIVVSATAGASSSGS
jgi:hypothetical protein